MPATPPDLPGRPDEPPASTPSLGPEGDDSSFWVAGSGCASEGSDGGPGGGSTSEGLPAFRTPAVGRRVGRYVLASKLGAGRQSVVWRAVQVDPPVRVVALKVFAPEWSVERVGEVARIRNRAAQLGPADGSAILPVHDFGEVAGHAYYTMPLIDGASLGETLARRREHLAAPPPGPHKRLGVLPHAAYFRAIAAVLARVARAVDDLHRSGFAHGDVKPDNILLDWADRPFLSDYGLARDLAEPSTSGEPPPPTGTPLYMSREKLAGARALDERLCDVYSLGVTLYEAATLARPFRIPKGLPRSVWASFLANLDPRPPRDRQPNLPHALESIILRAMHVDPSTRHPSALTLADDLQRFSADESSRARLA